MNYVKKAFSFINNVHIYIIASIIINIMYIVPSDFDIENMPMKIVFVWGVYLVAKDFFTKRIMFTSKYSPWLVALAVSFAISIVLNYPYQFPVTAYNWSYVMFALFLFYPFDKNEDFEMKLKWGRRFNDLFIIIIFILSLLSVITFVFDIQYWVLKADGVNWARQGFIENRLFGMYTSPNIGSILGLVSIALSVINNLVKGRKWYQFQTMYKWNIFIQYIFLILSSSRGTTLTFISISIIGFIYGIIYILMKSKNKLKEVWKYLIKGLAIAFLFFSVTSSVENGLSYVPPFVQTSIDTVIEDESSGSNDSSSGNSNESSSNSSSSDSSGGDISPVTIEHSSSESEVSSGRFTIWAAAYDLVKQRPLFGLGDADLYRDMQPYEVTSQVDMSKLSTLDRSEIQRAAGNMHNTYVQSFVHSGIVGTTILAIFALLYYIYHFRYVFSKRFDLGSRWNQIYLIILLLQIALLGLDLVENHVIHAERDPLGLTFWLYAGFLNFMRYHIDNNNLLNRESDLLDREKSDAD